MHDVAWHNRSAADNSQSIAPPNGARRRRHHESTALLERERAPTELTSPLMLSITVNIDVNPPRCRLESAEE